MADIKQKIGQKLALIVLFLDLKFCKNLGFCLSEHCEWGTWLFELRYGYAKFWTQTKNDQKSEMMEK